MLGRLKHLIISQYYNCSGDISSIINSSALMIQLTHESFFVPLQTIIKANAVKATDALDANWVADSLCTNALIKLITEQQH